MESHLWWIAFLTTFFHISIFSVFLIWHLQFCFPVVIARQGRMFNISWIADSHPILNPHALMSDANRHLEILLEMLLSASKLPGCVTITAVNRWAFSHWPSLFFPCKMLSSGWSHLLVWLDLNGHLIDGWYWVFFFFWGL